MNQVYALLYPLLWIFMRLFHPWKIVGDHRLPEGGALLCGNHTSIGDPCYVACAVGGRQQLRVLAKAELMRIPVLGYVLEKAGIIGINRNRADVAAIKTCIKVLKNGERLLVFPEGTRVREEETGEAHTGVAMFATRTGVPIVPIYISPRKRWFRKTAVIFGKPYLPEYEGKKATPEDYKRISEELMERIRVLGEKHNEG